MRFAAELVDRFGELPEEVKHLLDVVEIKGLARQAGVAQIDAGPKGAVIAFRKQRIRQPGGLGGLHAKVARRAQAAARPRMVFKADWDLPEQRLKGVRALALKLAEIAGAGRKAA